MFGLRSPAFFRGPPGFAVDLRSAVIERSAGEVISCAHQPSISLTLNLSIEIWLYIPGGVASGTTYGLCQKSPGSFATSGWSLWLTNDGFGGHLLSFLSGNGAGAYQHVGFTWEPAAATWEHLAFTYDVSQVQALESKAYVDTVSLGAPSIFTANDFSSIGANTEPLRWGNLGGNGFDGSMSEIRLWDHVRTPTQIADNYDKSIDPASSGLANYIHPTTVIEDVSPSATVITATGVAISTNVPF